MRQEIGAGAYKAVNTVSTLTDKLKSHGHMTYEINCDC